MGDVLIGSQSRLTGVKAER